MMKKTIVVILLIVLMLPGCGQTKDSEMVDIGQFKCEDSIETVFNILGETEISIDGLEGDRYEYDNLNLYGYEGKAVFKVRDDKDTISSFYCSFQLNDKERNDVLLLLENSYGEYEKSEYANQIAYVWDVSEMETNKLGYSRISLSDYGDKKVVIDFSDEWSGYNDKAYYEYLEEESGQAENSDAGTTFKFGNSGEMAIIIDEASSIKVYINSESAEECSLAFAYYFSSLSSDEMENCNVSILVNYTKDLSMLWNKTESGQTVTGINLDGSSTSELPDWIVTDLSKLTLSEDEQEKMVSELQENTFRFLNKEKVNVQ